MNLSESQLMQLKRGREMKENPPSMFSYLKSGRRTYLYMLFLTAGVSIVFWYWKAYGYLAFVLGYFLGVMYRDFQWSVVFRRFWPVSVEITNWQRVDDLIRENDDKAI
jgi:hypothetical protein